MLDTARSGNIVQVYGADICIHRYGLGKPLLVLHDENVPRPEAEYVRRLAEQHEVVFPEHPGWGASALPDHIDTVDDLAYLYLELLKTLDLSDVSVLGLSFGGWIAAEMAVRSTRRIGRLILADPVGIKPGGRGTRDITDLHSLPPAEVARALYRDPARGLLDPADHTDDEMIEIVRAQESFSLFAWDPYMYNPKLAQRLHQIDVPTLVIWGADDGFVTPSYGRAFCDAIPGARMVEIPDAGHFPHLEQPAAFVEAVIEFTAVPV